jgi:hypothetical protein
LVKLNTAPKIASQLTFNPLVLKRVLKNETKFTEILVSCFTCLGRGGTGIIFDDFTIA